MHPEQIKALAAACSNLGVGMILAGIVVTRGQWHLGDAVRKPKTHKKSDACFTSDNAGSGKVKRTSFSTSFALCIRRCVGSNALVRRERSVSGAGQRSMLRWSTGC